MIIHSSGNICCRSESLGSNQSLRCVTPYVFPLNYIPSAATKRIGGFFRTSGYMRLSVLAFYLYHVLSERERTFFNFFHFFPNTGYVTSGSCLPYTCFSVLENGCSWCVQLETMYNRQYSTGERSSGVHSWGFC